MDTSEIDAITQEHETLRLREQQWSAERAQRYQYIRTRTAEAAATLDEYPLPFEEQEARINADLCVTCCLPLDRHKTAFLCTWCVGFWAVCCGCRRILAHRCFTMNQALPSGRARWCKLCYGFQETMEERSDRRLRRAQRLIYLQSRGIRLVDCARELGYASPSAAAVDVYQLRREGRLPPNPRQRRRWVRNG